MEEAEVADRIALIDSGRIVALDTPQALKAKLGGGVIRLKTDDDTLARGWLVAQGYTPEAGAQELMLLHADPAAVLPEILKHMPVKVHRAEVREPSLEDVFLKMKGRGLGGESAAAPKTGKPN